MLLNALCFSGNFLIFSPLNVGADAPLLTLECLSRYPVRCLVMIGLVLAGKIWFVLAGIIEVILAVIYALHHGQN